MSDPDKLLAHLALRIAALRIAPRVALTLCIAAVIIGFTPYRH